MVIITGMHRSGTSCLTGSLQQKGLYLGKVFEQNPFNKKGNRENKQVMQLNESVLRTSGGSWDVPPDTITWTSEQAAKRDEILLNFKSSAYPVWGFKDPRALFTLPFWKDGVDNIQLVGSYRHPLLVAKSLYSRANAVKHGNHNSTMTLLKGLELWEAYNNKLLDYLEDEKFPLISFDQPHSDYISSIETISDFLTLNVKEKSSFRETRLVNQMQENESQSLLSDSINRLYEKLVQYSL